MNKNKTNHLGATSSSLSEIVITVTLGEGVSLMVIVCWRVGIWKIEQSIVGQKIFSPHFGWYKSIPDYDASTNFHWNCHHTANDDDSCCWSLESSCSLHFGYWYILQENRHQFKYEKNNSTKFMNWNIENFTDGRRSFFNSLLQRTQLRVFLLATTWHTQMMMVVIMMVVWNRRRRSQMLRWFRNSTRSFIPCRTAYCRRTLNQTIVNFGSERNRSLLLK